MAYMTVRQIRAAGGLGGVEESTKVEYTERVKNIEAQAASVGNDTYTASGIIDQATALKREIENLEQWPAPWWGYDGSANLVKRLQKVRTDMHAVGSTPQAEPTFTEVANDIGYAGAVFYPFYRMEQEVLPGQPLARTTEQVAADMRATGITPLVEAAEPQSGRDASTQPTIIGKTIGKGTKALTNPLNIGLLLAAGVGILMLSQFAKGRGMRASNPRWRRTYDPPRWAARRNSHG